MLLRSRRRDNRKVSSTATRIYQCLEWLLILGIALKDVNTHALTNSLPKTLDTPWTARLLSDLSLKDALTLLGAWQTIFLLAVLVVATTFEGRSQWMSLALYTVIFPQIIAGRKCQAQKYTSNVSNQCHARNVQISVVSFLQAFLHYWRPFGDWTPSMDQSIQILGYGLSAHNIYVSTLHLQILQLGRSLVGSSLSTIELDLLGHALTSFTLYSTDSICLDDFGTSMPETFFFSFLYGLLLAILPTISILKHNMRLARVRPQHRWKNIHKEQYKYAIYVYLIISAVIMTIVRSFLQWRLRKDPFVLVLQYLIDLPTRILLVAYWACTAGVGVIVVIYFWGSKPIGGLSGFAKNARRLLRHSTENDLHKATDKKEVYFDEEGTAAKRARALDRRRKFFHGLVVIMFLPTMNIDPDLSYLALSLAFTAFIFEEIVRVTVLPPFGVPIHKFLSGFTDHRDKTGHLVVSHLFLLIGVAGPVWLTRTGQIDDGAHHPTTNLNLNGAVAMLSGVLTLGAGDAAASIVGKKYGRHKWPSLKKSMEGTMAFVLAMLLAGYVAKLFSNGPDMDWKTFTVGVLMTGMMEAVSTENDNLIIPIYMWGLVF